MSFFESLSLEVIKALLAGASAAVVGVLVFLSGQFMVRFVFDPIVELRKTIGEVGYALVFYANALSNPEQVGDERLNEARTACRRLASLLSSQSRAIPWYDWIAKHGWIPCRNQISEASGELIGLGNTTARNYDWEKTIERFRVVRENLKLPQV